MTTAPNVEYTPEKLFDEVIKQLKLRNDAQLARMLEVAPPVISKMRHKRLPVGASMIIRIHECTLLSVREIRDLMGDQRAKYRVAGESKPTAEV